MSEGKGPAIFSKVEDPKAQNSSFRGRGPHVISKVEDSSFRGRGPHIVSKVEDSGLRHAVRSDTIYVPYLVSWSRRVLPQSRRSSTRFLLMMRQLRSLA